jgi:hypothetical protein
MAEHLKTFAIPANSLKVLLDTFRGAKTFGSLIQIPRDLRSVLLPIEAGLQQATEEGDVFARAAAQLLTPLLSQALILAMRFDAVIAKPAIYGQQGHVSHIAALC